MARLRQQRRRRRWRSKSNRRRSRRRALAPAGRFSKVGKALGGLAALGAAALGYKYRSSFKNLYGTARGYTSGWKNRFFNRNQGASRPLAGLIGWREGRGTQTDPSPVETYDAFTMTEGPRHSLPGPLYRGNKRKRLSSTRNTRSTQRRLTFQGGLE